ncbi:MAG: response regulator, partial [Gammaproteobacteria bacterium]
MSISTDPATLDGLNVLVLENNYEVSMNISSFLTRFGATVHAAKNEAAGIALFKGHRIDILITEIAEPKTDGLMWTEIRRLNSEIPIVFVSVSKSDLGFFTDGFAKTVKFSNIRFRLAELLKLLTSHRSTLLTALPKPLNLPSPNQRSSDIILPGIQNILSSNQFFDTVAPAQMNQWSENKYPKDHLSVLFVAQEGVAMEYLSKFLAQHVGKLYSTVNGEAALSLFNRHRPKLVIASVTLKGMNGGLELAEQIRAICPDVQIVLIRDVESWSYQESKILTLLKLAANKFLADPLNHATLLHAIQNCLDQYDMICDMNVSASKFMTANLAMIITDLEGNIITVNPAFSAMTAYTMDEVKGCNMRMLGSDMYGIEFYELIWTGINNRGRWSGEICSRRKSGESVWERLSISPVFNWKGRVSNYMSVYSVANQGAFAKE